jgi:hypothetical protein
LRQYQQAPTKLASEGWWDRRVIAAASFLNSSTMPLVMSAASSSFFTATIVPRHHAYKRNTYTMLNVEEYQSQHALAAEL